MAGLAGKFKGGYGGNLSAKGKSFSNGSKGKGTMKYKMTGGKHDTKDTYGGAHPIVGGVHGRVITKGNGRNGMQNSS
jgi:hypothetical protein